MDMTALAQERISLFRDTITGNGKANRVPHFGNLWSSWMAHDAGFKVSDALFDYNNLEKVMRHTAENYKLDSFIEVGWRNPLIVDYSIGNFEYVVDDISSSISIKDQCHMRVEEYDQLIADPKKFLWETIMPRKYTHLQKKENAGVYREFLQAYGAFGAYIGGTFGMLYNEYGSPNFISTNNVAFWGSYEYLFNNLRGFMGLSSDIHRCPDKVLAAIEALDSVFMDPGLEMVRSQPHGADLTACVDIFQVFLGHVILSEKQFEKFYLPGLMKQIKYAEECDKIVFLFAEGENSRLYDIFSSFPKDRVAILLEQDDIFEAKKRLPNMTICGGMPASLLGKGTPEECEAYAQKLIEELAYDGHYIFSADKMISFPYDSTSANMKAVCDYTYNFRF